MLQSSLYKTSAMPLLDSCERYFGTRDLYTVLSVGRDASDADLRRAYRQQALLVHPDRVDAAQRPTATASFQVLSKVHSVLTDKEHRALYDEQGIVDEENDTITQDKDWDQYFRLLFKKITVADIRAFEEAYRESEEERDDLKKAYLDSRGDMNQILETMLCASIEDEPRFLNFLETSIKAGDLPTYPAFSKESKQKRESRRRRYREEAREAEETAKEIGLDGTETSLAALMKKQQEKHQGKMESLLDNLESKYSRKNKGSAGKASGKRKGKK
uniref:DnaJ homolog subfamily C member 9 n=2 Tax=Eptatretus burgeri TaxID=7764 RepID=A0A8C4X0W6_EPTBU